MSSPGASAAASSLDLETYLASYAGYTRLRRLAFIASASPAHKADALRMAVADAKRGTNTAIFSELLTLAAGDGLVVADDTWVDQVDRKALQRLDKLELDLNTHKTSLVKEAIRMGHNDLGDFHYERGDFATALKCFVRTRDYCTTSKHIIAMCLNVIRASVQMGELDAPTRTHPHPAAHRAPPTVQATLITSPTTSPRPSRRRMRAPTPPSPPSSRSPRALRASNRKSARARCTPTARRRRAAAPLPTLRADTSWPRASSSRCLPRFSARPRSSARSPRRTTSRSTVGSARWPPLTAPSCALDSSSRQPSAPSSSSTQRRACREHTPRTCTPPPPQSAPSSHPPTTSPSPCPPDRSPRVPRPPHLPPSPSPVQVREAATDFFHSRYGSCLSQLEKLKPDLMLDLHLHDHVATLYADIRSKALVQYFSAFVTVDMARMAEVLLRPATRPQTPSLRPDPDPPPLFRSARPSRAHSTTSRPSWSS